MRIAGFQFAAGADLAENFAAIKRGIAGAAAQDVRLLVFQECAACGYPPVERPDMAGLDADALERGIAEVGRLARAHGMAVGLGTARREAGRWRNSMVLYGPDGRQLGHYDKRALWGWDRENFEPGEPPRAGGGAPGVFELDGVTAGLRICFEVRFPEYFRELFRAGAGLCFVSLCYVAEAEQPETFDMIRAHLMSRAAENAMTVVSVNGISGRQTAPTAVFGPSGRVLAEAPRDTEHLLVYDWEQPELSYSDRGRLEHSRWLLGV